MGARRRSGLVDGCTTQERVHAYELMQKREHIGSVRAGSQVGQRATSKYSFREQLTTDFVKRLLHWSGAARRWLC